MGLVPEDKNIPQYDMAGKLLYDLEHASRGILAVVAMARKFDL